MMYHQITFEERYTLGLLRQQGLTRAAIARVLGRHRSTIGREVRRNGATSDGSYRPQLADWYARGRRSRSRRNRRFSTAGLQRVRTLLAQQWSPEQIAGYLRRRGILRISHETIYRYIWADKRAGGELYRQLRGARKQRRKRYGRYDSRGRLAGKRPITARPAAVERRSQVGHWEVDTMLGAGQAGPCVLSMVERKTGYVVLGKLQARTTTAVNRRATQLIRRQRRPVRTITADNGTEDILGTDRCLQVSRTRGLAGQRGRVEDRQVGRDTPPRKCTMELDDVCGRIGARRRDEAEARGLPAGQGENEVIQERVVGFH